MVDEIEKTIENENYYFYLFEDGHVDGWSSTEAPGTIKVHKPSVDVLERPFAYKLVGGEFILDIEGLLAKERVKVLASMELVFQQKMNYGFLATIKGTTYRYPYELEHQLVLQNLKELFSNNMIRETTITMLDKESGEPVRVRVDKTSLQEVYLLGFLHKDKLISKLWDELTSKINKAQTLEELSAIEWI